MNETVADLIRQHGTFTVYTDEMGGTVIKEYTVEGLDYVVVVFPNSDVEYTYVKGNNV